jgi:hypothetical protein
VILGEIDNEEKDSEKLISNIKIPKDEKDENILIVEVKFSKNREWSDHLRRHAAEQHKRWNPSYLFIATLRGFFFGKCDEILKNDCIKKLEERYIPAQLQKKYLDILREFEK